MNKVDVGAYRIRPECAHLSLRMYSGVCDTPLQLIAAICRSQWEDGFAACNLPLPTGGRFRSLQFAAPGGRTVLQLAICRSQREDGFAACNLPLSTGGRFRSLQFAVFITSDL